LRRNLQFAVPDLIHDAQASGGSISTTFKLYKDLTVVCESLDSLLPPGSREGKTEPTALSNDLSVIVDDNIPEKPSPKKRRPSNQ
jgi:hypothetical protein